MLSGTLVRLWGICLQKFIFQVVANTDLTNVSSTSWTVVFNRLDIFSYISVKFLFGKLFFTHAIKISSSGKIRCAWSRWMPRWSVSHRCSGVICVQLHTLSVLPCWISHRSSSSRSASTGAAAGGRLHRLPDGLAERLQPRAAAGPQAGGPRLQQEIHHAQSLWFSPPGWARPPKA